MGREVEAHVMYQGQTGLVRALLESDALILRGEVRLRLPRAGLQGWQADGDDLRLRTTAGDLVLTIGAKDAASWVAALRRPVPTLHEKLGLTGAAIWLLRVPDDVALEQAVAGIPIVPPAQATLGIAVIRCTADLNALLAVCVAHAELVVWAINKKGKAARIAESTIRTALRGLGMVDTKACAVSTTLSGTRYQRRRG